MGGTEKRELLGRLTVLLAHLLKWRHQPARRGAFWEVTIGTQRRAIARHLADNPSLKSKPPGAIEDAYIDARAEAYAETGLPKATFPPACPWSFERMMTEDFWPSA
jgi:hypothetical protein